MADETPTRRFEPGDLVEWTSQSSGGTATKRGTVIEVVLPHQAPKTNLRKPGRPRDHESYVIRAKKLAPRTRLPFGPWEKYWPRVEYLRYEWENET